MVDIGATATYTDNVSLDEPQDRGDVVMQVTPGIHIEGVGARFKASLDYEASAIFYARTSRQNEIINTLNALGNLEVVEKFFFVDVYGKIGQSYLSPLQARPADVFVITRNRTEVTLYGISPYIRGQFGSGYSYEVRNRNTWSSATSDLVGDAQTTQWTGRLSSPVRLFAWALEYDDSRTSYDNFSGQPDQNSKIYRGRLFFQPDEAVRLSASAGREENDYSLQEERSYDTYGVGLLWRPSARTSAEVEYERRFFGPSSLASLRHRTRLTAWTIAYSKNASNYPQQLLTLPPGNTAALLDAIFASRIPDPVERRAAVERFLRATGTPPFLATSLAFFTQQVFIDERVDASVAILGKRNSVTLTLFGSESTTLPDSVASLVPDALVPGTRVRQHGFGLMLNHQATAFTSLGVGATTIYARQEVPSDLESRSSHLSFTLNKVLSPKTTTFAGLSYSHFTSPGTASADRDIRTAVIGVSHQF